MFSECLLQPNSVLLIPTLGKCFGWISRSCHEEVSAEICGGGLKAEMLYGGCSAVFLIQIIFQSWGSAALDVLLKNYSCVSVLLRCDGSALASRSDLVCNELLKWLLTDLEGDALFEAIQRRATLIVIANHYTESEKSYFHSMQSD